ncbi:MAG: LacI family DNA-binding transcriptional regulator [Propionibacteriaceae bacterium]|nr:LacI family DNA-binding transcriptional regulator [Propionibacteriaceae bacterium]
MNDVNGGGATGYRAPTLTDVAKLAGVSTMTVSRVINGHAKVAADTRERVLVAMKSLDYRPNMMARGLASGRSRSIGVLTVDTTLYGPRAALRGIEGAARDRGYTVTISHLNDPDRTAVAQGANLLRSRSSDGVILLQPLISEVPRNGGPADLPPMVAIHAGTPGDYPVVSVDQRLGARLATEHLLSLGHRTVWHISGPTLWYEGVERVLGWQEALTDARAEVPPVFRGDWSAESGYAAAMELFRSPGVTAIFVGNDSMALGTLHAMHELGLRCPEDVSLVGFDDYPEAAYFSPGLTTIRQDFDEIGQRSVELLVQLIESDGPHTQHLVLPPQLIVRASTAPPKA